jgi:hypothetical protein
MKSLITSLCLSGISLLASIAASYAQADTVVVSTKNLKIKDLKFGKSTYLIYAKRAKDKPVQNQTLVEINVSKHSHNGADAVTIQQNWYESDTLSHTAYTLLRANDLGTIQHNYWWKRTGQKFEFDFEKNVLNIEGKMTDTQRAKQTKTFETAAESGHFLNWHCDLSFFPLLPFKENAVFKVNFYDPGFSLPKYEIYQVIKSEAIEGIDCWVLEHTLPKNMGYQRFWIAKKAKELIKEEDSFNGAFRYKLKMIVSE